MIFSLVKLAGGHGILQACAGVSPRSIMSTDAHLTPLYHSDLRRGTSTSLLSKIAAINPGLLSSEQESIWFMHAAINKAAGFDLDAMTARLVLIGRVGMTMY